MQNEILNNITPMNPLWKKLHYNHQQKLLILNAPDEMMKILHGINAKVDTDMKSKYPFILCFIHNRAEAEKVMVPLIHALEHDGYLWLCYPKQTSRNYRANINRDSLWELFKPTGFRPVSQIAIDDDWSALRFRESDRVGT
jgi:hypothetical protein